MDPATEYTPDDLTGIELLLQRAEAVLQAAGLPVHRHQAGAAWKAEDCPAVLLRRGATTDAAESPIGRSDTDMVFSVHCLVAVPSWETAADALHKRAHRALLADPEFARMGLTCQATDAGAASGDQVVGEVVVAYGLTAPLDPDLNLWS